MAVFCRTMKEVSNLSFRAHMLDNIIALLEDANVFSWAAAKASHEFLLCHLEQGELSYFSQVETNCWDPVN